MEIKCSHRAMKTWLRPVASPGAANPFISERMLNPRVRRAIRVLATACSKEIGALTTSPYSASTLHMLPAMKDASVLLAVPNFSEGRSREVIDQIVSAASDSAARVLDVHSDPDHNRTVLTAAGPSPGLVDAMVAATSKAAQLIDLNAHEGVHPRTGAMDVVPFVPILGSAMKHAVAAAADCAERIAGELGVPCFLYAESARSAERRDLPRIRRAAFREWEPDLGGPRPHPTAGGTVVGARGLLVAFNVNLASQDLNVADRIARAVRSTGAGPPGLRAMGVALKTKGIVQVSMNLIRPLITTIADAFDAVARAARMQGVAIVESELVGLAPRAAFAGRTPESLGLRTPPKILEEELANLPS